LKILFDQGTPAPLRYMRPGHDVESAFERSWQALQNGDLLTAAEQAGFDLVITTDQNLRYQQNLSARSLAIIVLSTTDWRRIKTHARLVGAAVDALSASAYVEVQIP
jgi:hypothetical protein